MSYCLQHIEGGETNVNVTQPRSNYGGQGYKRNFEGALTLRKGFFKTTWGNQDQADGQGERGEVGRRHRDPHHNRRERISRVLQSFDVAKFCQRGRAKKRLANEASISLGVLQGTPTRNTHGVGSEEKHTLVQ